MSTLLVGIGLMFGLSASLLEWANHIAAVPQAAYVLVFPPLLLAAGRSVPPTAPDRLTGLIWIAAAAATEVLAFGGGVERLGRLAIPLGIVGFIRFTGSAPIGSAALAFFVVPVPMALTSAVGLEQVWQAFGEFLLGPTVPSFELGHWDSGIRLVALCAGLGWYGAARHRVTWNDSLRQAIRLAMLGLPIQLAAVLIAFALVRAEMLDAARALLSSGVWILCTIAIVAPIEIGRRREVATHV